MSEISGTDPFEVISRVKLEADRLALEVRTTELVAPDHVYVVSREFADAIGQNRSIICHPSNELAVRAALRECGIRIVEPES